MSLHLLSPLPLLVKRIDVRSADVHDRRRWRVPKMTTKGFEDVKNSRSREVEFRDSHPERVSEGRRRVRKPMMTQKRNRINMTKHYIHYYSLHRETKEKGIWNGSVLFYGVLEWRGRGRTGVGGKGLPQCRPETPCPT